MKIDLVTIDKEERARGKGFMKRVKERWDQKYPEYQQASWQKLRDNAAQFKKCKANIVCIPEGSGHYTRDM